MTPPPPTPPDDNSANPRTVPVLPLTAVLNQGEQVQEKVEEAATELSSVNDELKSQSAVPTSLADVVDVLDRSAGVEAKMQEAADELVAMNDALAAHIDERSALEDALTASNVALASSLLREKRARHDALHDTATGLPTAQLFREHLDHALSQAERHSWQLAVMFIDLDGFKQINDTHGHDVGDDVLQLVAERLTVMVRGGDAVARRSGDEFLFLMLEAQSRASAQAMARRLLKALAVPAEIRGVTISVRASIGIAMYPEDGETASALLTLADKAMYVAKRTPAMPSPVIRGS